MNAMKKIMAIAVWLAFGVAGAFCSEPVSSEELALRPEYRVPFVMLGDEARSSAAGEDGDGAVEVILDADTHSVTFHFLCGFASVGISVYKDGRKVMSAVCSPMPGESFVDDLSRHGRGQYLVVFDSMEEGGRLWCKFSYGDR